MVIPIDVVKNLIKEQFPQYSDLEIRPVEKSGHDNRSFRLGDALTIRMPSHKRYEPAVEKEYRHLPYLAKNLSLPIPMPVAIGQANSDYPYTWLINTWIDGETISNNVDDKKQLAVDLALFLKELKDIEVIDPCPAGVHSFYRGGDLSMYHDDTLRYIDAVEGMYPRKTIERIWSEALATHYTSDPVWVHGDVAVGNLLVDKGRLSGVIDFGTSCTGDPACDYVMAWTYFDEVCRAVFFETLNLDEAMIARAKGWALWKALFTIVVDNKKPELVAWAKACMDALLG